MEGTLFKIHSNWSYSLIAEMCWIYSELIKTTAFLDPLEKSFWYIDTCIIAWQIPKLISSSYLQLVSEYVGVGSVQIVDIDVGNPLLPAKQFVIWKA